MYMCSIERLVVRVDARAGLRCCVGVPTRVTVALTGLLLLLHHELDHVVLIHEFLTVADSIFALQDMALFRVKVLALRVRAAAHLRTQGPLKVWHVSVVRPDSGLAGKSVCRGLIGELWLVLLG